MARFDGGKLKGLGLLLVLGLLPACAALVGTQPLAPDLRRGQELYNRYCLGCHGGPTGGSMLDYPPRHNASGHTWHHPDCQLKEIIKNGGDEMTAMMRRMMAPADAPKMPAFKDTLSDADIEALLAFIKSWWTEDQRRHQAQVTRAQCPQQGG
ncbi:MAG: cytochrome C [Chloroflexota bacterium]